MYVCIRNACRYKDQLVNLFFAFVMQLSDRKICKTTRLYRA